MVEVAQRRSLRETVGHIWLMPLTQRLLALIGLALIVGGYDLIMSSADLPNAADVQAVTRVAVGGMLLVVFGGVVEVLVLLSWSHR